MTTIRKFALYQIDAWGDEIVAVPCIRVNLVSYPSLQSKKTSTCLFQYIERYLHKNNTANNSHVVKTFLIYENYFATFSFQTNDPHMVVVNDVVASTSEFTLLKDVLFNDESMSVAFIQRSDKFKAL